MLYLDAGTTYSKIITDKNCLNKQFLVCQKNNLYYYIMPSAEVKAQNIIPDACCGHMSQANENEIVALAKGAKKYGISSNATILDLGSRDAKWIRFENNKFHDMDWNTSCAAATGATIEMLLKFYDVRLENLVEVDEKYNITCGIFGLEKIMDDISRAEAPEVAISKFINGIAQNAYNFTKKPEKIYLSGGFCDNLCFVNSLSKYCEVVPLGRFVLAEGLLLA